jgi:hypothetical protein
LAYGSGGEDGAESGSVVFGSAAKTIVSGGFLIRRQCVSWTRDVTSAWFALIERFDQFLNE